MSSHARVMDAKAYWEQFVTAFYFERPGDTVAGTLYHYSQEGPTKDPVPRLYLQTKEGRRHYVTVTQERLKAALQDACPAVGDAVRITYTGDAERAAPGMNKAKLFNVEVRRRPVAAVPPQEVPK